MSDAPTGSGSPAKPPVAQRTRWLRLALAALAVVQFGSYFWIADEAMPRAGLLLTGLLGGGTR